MPYVQMCNIIWTHIGLLYYAYTNNIILVLVLCFVTYNILDRPQLTDLFLIRNEKKFHRLLLDSWLKYYLNFL